jgi:hypothetical protein
MTYEQALNTIPSDRKWSSSFGNPGEGGYVEYWRTADGRRFSVSNGSYLETAKLWFAKVVP